MSDLPLPEKVEAIHRRLADSRIPHAFGGAVALAYYAEPRATVDIDLNLFVEPSQFGAIRDALESLGIDFGSGQSTAERDGQCRLWWGEHPIDLFFDNDPLHDEMRRSTRKVAFRGLDLPILSPEHLIICKAMFDRPKDWFDIEEALTLTPHLDLDEINRWLATLGTDDPRHRRFNELAQRVLGS